MKIGNMRNNRGKPISLGIFLTWIAAISISLIGSDVFASSIQHHEPETIFAASCSTCHGAAGLGGVTFVKDGVGDNRTAPQIAGKPARYIKAKVRSGSKNAAMPAFGKEEITDAELNALANWLEKGGDDEEVPNGVEAPDAPGSTSLQVRLDILDADPWFLENDLNDLTAMVTGPSTSSDDRRVVLSSGQYLKVVNTGRTWHTLTNSKKLRDSGFIGYAGNYRETPGDLDQGVSTVDGASIGYYYAEQAGSPTNTESGLAYGCTKYWCKMHPYMAVEVCGDGNVPGVLTRASKDPMGSNPPVAGVGEVWVTVQSQEEANELHTVDVGWYSPNSTGDPFGVGNDFDGVYQVIHADTSDAGAAWTTIDYIANVGNNPHNSWPGKDAGPDGISGTSDDNAVVISANWHDNTIDVMDVATKSFIMEKRSGTTNAHVMVAPNSTAANRDFYVTHMGGRAVQRLDVDQFELGFDPNISPGAMSGDGMTLGATGPHGLWMCDPQLDGTDDGTAQDNYILTADTFAGGATIYAADYKTSKSTGSGGSAPLAPSIMSGFNDSSRTDDGPGCARGFTNNALTTDVSIYNLAINPLGIKRLPQAYADVAATATPNVDYNTAGNINLKDLTASGCTNVTVGAGQVCTDPVRWASLPIQTPVSPSDSTHARYMVTANKASFNVSITRLDSGTGMPDRLFTFPGGLGAHGVTYGKKAVCDSGPSNTCYYAYVTNTFEGGRNRSEINTDSYGNNDGKCEAQEICDESKAGYVSVYDLEKIGTSALGNPGTAFSLTAAHTGPATTVAGLSTLDSFVPAISGETVYLEGAAPGIVLCDLLGSTLCSAVGLSAYDILAPSNTASLDIGTINNSASDCKLVANGADGMPDIAQIADCVGLIEVPVCIFGVGCTTAGIINQLGPIDTAGSWDMDGDGVFPDLRAPITAVCPDCRSGVHVGDVHLNGAPNLISDSTEYTYYQADVYVDDANSLVAKITSGNLLNGTVGFGGQINKVVPNIDLDLQINTGAQGIVGYPAATPW